MAGQKAHDKRLRVASYAGQYYRTARNKTRRIDAAIAATSSDKHKGHLITCLSKIPLKK